MPKETKYGFVYDKSKNTPYVSVDALTLADAKKAVRKLGYSVVSGYVSGGTKGVEKGYYKTYRIETGKQEKK